MMRKEQLEQGLQTLFLLEFQVGALALPCQPSMLKLCLWEAPFYTCDLKSLGEEQQANVNSNAVLENHSGGQ